MRQKTKHPAYIIADFPEPMQSMVSEIRHKYGNFNDSIPVEITLAGSSGVGPIPVGSDIGLIISEVDKVTSGLSSFELSFAGWNVFPNTTLAYLEPMDRAVFDELHHQFISTDIPFTESPFPYNPHCTISSGFDKESLAKVLESPFPEAGFTIDTISVCDLNPETLECEYLHRVSLTEFRK